MSFNREERINSQRDRHIYRGACNCVLLFIEAAAFYVMWVYVYNPYFRNPYVFKGNVLSACIYAIFLMIFQRLYGRQELGYHKTFNIIFGLSITAVIVNVLSYFVIIIQAASRYVTPVYAIIFLSLFDIAVIIIWSLCFNSLFHRIFPPNRLLLVADRNIDVLNAKFGERGDRYKIVRHLLIDGSFDKKKFMAMSDELYNYDGVIIGDICSEQRNDILKICYSKGIRTYTLPKISDVILKSSDVMEVFDSPIFLNRNMGLSFEQTVIKRISDIILGLIGLIISAPIMLIIAIAIKAEDGGPVFYTQRRCTRGGKEFDIIKFRSMIVNAEEQGISMPATENDKRITKVGAVIRALRFDELPQIFNILKGEMSVVGPRPERIEHVRAYTEDIPEFEYRMSVKGGLTGYAQVYGRYNTSPYDKLKLDLMYIQNYSLVLDLEIILKTIQVLFTKDSTEGFDVNNASRLTEASRNRDKKKNPDKKKQGKGKKGQKEEKKKKEK